MEGEKLLRTETNSSDDSKGVAFGLQGNLFIPVVASGVVSVIMLTLLITGSGMSIPNAMGIAAIPFVLTLIVVMVFLNDKPPHYLADWWDTIISDGSFARHTYHPPHPLDAAKEIAAKREKKNGKSA